MLNKIAFPKKKITIIRNRKYILTHEINMIAYILKRTRSIVVRGRIPQTAGCNSDPLVSHLANGCLDYNLVP